MLPTWGMGRNRLVFISNLSAKVLKSRRLADTTKHLYSEMTEDMRSFLQSQKAEQRNMSHIVMLQKDNAMVGSDDSHFF